MTDEQFADYWRYLVEKVNRSTYHGLSKDERVFYSANILRGSVPRSGLVGYFENTECNVIRDVKHSLSTLGLSEVLKLIQDAEAVILRGNSLPETDQFLELFDEGLPAEELENAMDELDENVRDIERRLCLEDQALFEVLCRFADEKCLGVRTD